MTSNNVIVAEYMKVHPDIELIDALVGGIQQRASARKIEWQI